MADSSWKPAAPEPDLRIVQAHQSPGRPDPTWKPVEPDLPSIHARCPDPLRALSEARMPAIILRNAYPPPHCDGLIRRFIDRGLMRDPKDPALASDARRRIDIGTSLGNRGHDQEAFLRHAVETRELFRTLFDGFEDPVRLIYETLSALAIGKKVTVACEPDGRRYGPAIFRIHYSDHAYKPHIDHVVLREKRFNYAVSRFRHQFAGVLCLQNDQGDGGSTQAILHRCLWTPEIQSFIQEGTFHAYAAEHNIGHCRVELNPGDLYFFNTRCIHEVPAIQGKSPRIVLAVFIGYSPEDAEVFVWS